MSHGVSFDSLWAWVMYQNATTDEPLEAKNTNWKFFDLRPLL